MSVRQIKIVHHTEGAKGFWGLENCEINRQEMRLVCRLIEFQMVEQWWVVVAKDAIGWWSVVIVHYNGIDRAGDSTIAIGSCAASDKTSSAKNNGEQLEQLEQFNLLGTADSMFEWKKRNEEKAPPRMKRWLRKVLKLRIQPMGYRTLWMLCGQWYRVPLIFPKWNWSGAGSFWAAAKILSILSKAS